MGSFVESTAFRQGVDMRNGAEAALRAERDFISAVFETIGALVLVLDREGRVLRFNRACQETTSYSLDEVKGKSIWGLALLGSR